MLCVATWCPSSPVKVALEHTDELANEWWKKHQKYKKPYHYHATVNNVNGYILVKQSIKIIILTLRHVDRRRRWGSHHQPSDQPYLLSHSCATIKSCCSHINVVLLYPGVVSASCYFGRGGCGRVKTFTKLPLSLLAYCCECITTSVPKYCMNM